MICLRQKERLVPCLSIWQLLMTLTGTVASLASCWDFCRRSAWSGWSCSEFVRNRSFILTTGDNQPNRLRHLINGLPPGSFLDPIFYTYDLPSITSEKIKSYHFAQRRPILVWNWTERSRNVITLRPCAKKYERAFRCWGDLQVQDGALVPRHCAQLPCPWSTRLVSTVL